MTDFKVGDKVRRIECDYRDAKVGEIYTVLHVDDDTIRIDANEKRNYVIYTKTLFELVESKQKQQKQWLITVLWEDGDTTHHTFSIKEEAKETFKKFKESQNYKHAYLSVIKKEHHR